MWKPNRSQYTGWERSKTKARERPRLLKVVLPASHIQRIVMKQSKQLKMSNFKNIFIRPSLTKKQRDADFRLREECRTKNKAAPYGTVYLIVRGNITQVSGNV